MTNNWKLLGLWLGHDGVEESTKGIARLNWPSPGPNLATLIYWQDPNQSTKIIGLLPVHWTDRIPLSRLSKLEAEKLASPQSILCLFRGPRLFVSFWFPPRISQSNSKPYYAVIIYNFTIYQVLKINFRSTQHKKKSFLSPDSCAEARVFHVIFVSKLTSFFSDWALRPEGLSENLNLNSPRNHFNRFWGASAKLITI